MRRQVHPRALLPALIGLLFLGALLAPLALPGNVLATRDIPFFHLPLRTTFKALLGQGLPEWNPLIHGGQPILSNPNYAAFYPPTWIALALPTHLGIGLLIVAHAFFAFAGAWRLQRHLGGDTDDAALAALAFAGGSWFLSLTSTLNFFCGMAWFPWVLRWGDELLTAERRERTVRPALFAATALALQLLAGEPVAVLVSALALAAFALGRGPYLTRSLRRLVPVALLAAGLAAVQLAPTALRLRGSIRAQGLQPEVATLWSAPPDRLVEILLPRFWGDPARDEENLYFGWGVHDRDYPYVGSIYTGLLPTVLALAALAGGRIPRRLGWAVAAVAGLILGLGRHSPLFGFVQVLPVLSMVRYPEKFLVLSVAVMPFVGALGWQRLTSPRREGEPPPHHLAVGLAGAVALVAAVLWVALVFRPDLGEAFVRSHSGLEPTPAIVGTGLAFLRREAVASFVLAALTMVLLSLAGKGRWKAWLTSVACLLVAVDLWHYAGSVRKTLPIRELLKPPPMLATLLPEADRVFTDFPFDSRPEINLRIGPVGFYQMLGRMERLDPYSGTIWGLAYALHLDFDLMLTPWGQHAIEPLGTHPTGYRLRRLLGTWGVTHIISRRAPEDVLDEIRRTGRPPYQFLLVRNPQALPRYRRVERFRTESDRQAALDLVVDRGFEVADEEIVVGAAPPDWPQQSAPGKLLEGRGQGKKVSISYRADGPTLLVAAITFDPGWRAATGDGRPLTIRPTALGQMILALPGGEGTVELTYREPAVRWGAGITGTAVLLALFAAARARRGVAST